MKADPHAAEREEAGALPGRRVVAVGYYGLPVLRRPHWQWQIPLYFFLSGLAGMSQLIATVADVFGSEEDRAVATTGRWLALAGVAIAPVLLIDDLTVPGRFHHMLRIFKTRSPMSVGSWLLTAFGGAAALSCVLELLGARAGARRIVGGLSAPLAAAVAGYTGVLLSATAVPLWGRARGFLSPLFVCSSASTALAAISIVLKLTGHARPATSARLRELELLALAGELAAVSGALRVLGPLARPLVAHPYGQLFWGGSVVAGQVLPLLAHARHLVRPAQPGALDLSASLLVLGGGWLTRWLFVQAGKKSADDPQAAFAYHR